MNITWGFSAPWAIFTVIVVLVGAFGLWITRPASRIHKSGSA